MLSGLSFLMNPKALLRMGLMVAAAILALKIWGFVETAFENAQRVIEQEVVIQLKDGEIDTLNASIEQIKEAEEIAERARLAGEEREGELRAVRDGALLAGDEKNGPIAPVLGDVLRALRN